MCLFGLEIRKDAASTARERETHTSVQFSQRIGQSDSQKHTGARTPRSGPRVREGHAHTQTTHHTHFTHTGSITLTAPENTPSPQSVSRHSRFLGMIGQKLTTPCGAGDCPPARRCPAPQCSGRAPWCSPRGSACRPRTTRWSTSRTARWEAGRGAASGR